MKTERFFCSETNFLKVGDGIKKMFKSNLHKNIFHNHIIFKATYNGIAGDKDYKKYMISPEKLKIFCDFISKGYYTECALSHYIHKQL